MALVPTDFGALAAGPPGELFVADPRGNRIFVWHPDSKRFTVFAGTGNKGFSGDGGFAVNAQINYPGGMVYDDATQTLYFADEGNSRVRAIGPSGRIRNVVGDGRNQRWVSNGTPAQSASLLDASDVALSPSGQLVIADEGQNEILLLGSDGRLAILSGDKRLAGVVGVGGPAQVASPDGPDGLVYDSAGNLWDTGFNTKTLLVVTPAGLMRRPIRSAVYPRGDGGIVRGPGGTVDVMDDTEIDQCDGLSGFKVLMDFGTLTVRGVHGIAPTGLARMPSGLLYFGTWTGDGYTNKTALFSFDPATRQVKLLWEAH